MVIKSFRVREWSIRAKAIVSVVVSWHVDPENLESGQRFILFLFGYFCTRGMVERASLKRNWCFSLFYRAVSHSLTWEKQSSTCRDTFWGRITSAVICAFSFWGLFITGKFQRYFWQLYVFMAFVFMPWFFKTSDTIDILCVLFLVGYFTAWCFSSSLF